MSRRRRDAGTLWRWLVEPSPRIRQAERQHQARMLAALLLTGSVVGLAMALLGLNPVARELVGEPELALAMGMGLFSLFTYVVNRQGYTDTAVRLVVYVGALAIYLTAVSDRNPQMLNSLVRLVIPLLVGAIFMSLRELALVVSVNLAGVLAFPLFAPRVTFIEVLSGPFGFVLVCSILVMLLSFHLRNMERVRQHNQQITEVRSRQLLEAAFDAILIHHDDRLIDAGYDFQRLFGYEKPTGLSFSSLIADQQHSAYKADAKLCEVTIRRRDGSTFFAEMITIEQTYQDQPVKVTAVRDISRTRRMEAALRDSERRFRLVTEHSPDFMYIWEADANRLPYFNRDGFLGYTREELLVPGFLASLVHPDDWPALQTYWQTALQQAEAATCGPIEYRIRHSQGHWEWLERRDTVLTHNVSGNPQQMLVTLSIITQRKRAEEELRQQERQNRALLEAIPDLIVHFDAEGTYLQAWPFKHPADYAQLIPAEDLIGRSMRDVLPPDLAEALTGVVRRALATQEIQQYEYSLLEHGSLRHYEGRWAACGENETIATIRDVTDRKRAEELLEREANIYQSLFEAMILSEWRDGWFYIRSMNRAAEQLYGWSQDEVRGRPIIDVVRPSYHDPDMTRELFVANLLRTGYWRGEMNHHHRDGTPLHLLVSITVLKDQQGQPAGTAMIALDMTRLRAAEAALRMSEERFQTALKGAPIVVSNQDRELRYTWIHNPSARFDPSQVIGKRDQELMEQVEDARLIEALKQQVIESGVGLRRAVQWQEKGEIRHFDLTIEPVRDALGSVSGITCAQIDITERIQEEAARHKIQHMLQTLVANVPMVILGVDRSGVITFTEGTVLREMGERSNHLVGSSIYEITADRPSFRAGLERALAGETVTNFGERDGRHFQNHFHPVFNSSGEIDTVVAIAIDITERVRSERHQLDLALERERIDMLQRFMGDVSHDFKTPLTSIKLSLHLLGKIQTDADRQRHLEVIAYQANRLEKFMSDLFHMSRFDQSITGEFDFGPVDINALLRAVLAAHEYIIQQHGHTVRIDTQAEIPATFGDPFELDRVFTNLLVNAVNYTPDGGQITLRTRCVDGNVIVEVQDTGIGIPPDEQERIFARFYRSDPARSAERGGMGVGLSIARKIVEAHGGRIEVESTPGEGSTFRVILPVLSV